MLVNTVADFTATNSPLAYLYQFCDLDRNIVGITASAVGLYLVQVRYPEHFAVPQAVRLPGFG